MLFLLEHQLGTRLMNHKEPHMSGHPLHQCSLPSRHRSGMEAFHNEADQALELELVLVEVWEGLVWVQEWELAVWVAQELAPVVEEDPPWANHTYRPCTSFPFHIANQDCISSRTAGKECHIAPVHHGYQRGSLKDTRHQR
jgi:hypothetical protein